MEIQNDTPKVHTGVYRFLARQNDETSCKRYMRGTVYVEQQTVILSVAQIPLRVGKGYNGFTQGGAFPANANYEWLRNIGRI